MKLTIPPVVQFAVAALAMWLIDWQLPQFAISFAGQQIVSGAVFMMGLAIGVIAVAGFRQAETTVHPMDPSKASRLVISGLYKFTRNPMYLGLLLCLAGVGGMVRQSSEYECACFFRVVHDDVPDQARRRSSSEEFWRRL